MREFEDQDGEGWTARVAEREGPNYKGRFHLVMTSAQGEAVELEDIQWNSERTAQRTLDTMSLVELRRRLSSARGRAAR